MAQKRMFSKTITNSSRFLMMPQSSQNLYFHLGMNADDDGFCEHFTIMRMTESKPDDLKILQAKQFIKVFDDHVLVILDWKENNYLRQDRYNPSKYLEIYKNEIIQLSNGIPPVSQNVDKMDTQIRLDKISIDKYRIDKKQYLDIIFLSENEYNKLIKEYGEELIKEKIESLNNYLLSIGRPKKYKSHYHTILAWIKKDNIKIISENPPKIKREIKEVIHEPRSI